MQLNSLVILRKYKWAIVLIVFTVLAWPIYNQVISRTSQAQETELETIETPDTPSPTIAALGRIVPKDGVINISGAGQLADVRVIELQVQEGETVIQGQVLALLDPFYAQQASLTRAEKRMAVAQAQLEGILAGDAKLGDLAAQEAQIANLEAQVRTEVIEQQALITRMQAELVNAESSYQRFQTLYNEGAISIADLEDKQEAFEIAQARLDEVEAQLENIQSTRAQQIRRESATLDKLTEVRPVDVTIAQAELEEATAAVAEAEATVELARVRAPVAGRVLKIHTQAGERVKFDDGILELGQTQAMYVLAEVYETDISRLKPGQTATVKISALMEALQGTVEQISPQIDQKGIFNNDPALGIDARVFEVKIRLDPSDSQKVEQFIHMEADVTIQTP
ncbi:HlyD family efflux transporter periplasmic adaptor subunit [Leptolyngbyaceae cyanobacterium CCMR0082]|uniref:HlyD family efflux transporter periplasmic adaptor subunit n=1 Tax=Adonisia turfae CCMR0082 TaxID=2304604 RepID=A0A6M0S905_9CYAN|nr:HlyD family efflux transporter periplasmic adaptor subunit [Adonisia turfae]MDV3347381.1 efflux RND transporter periplasmic adaptor subunit [Leptothoe sp. LEGE 181152]NEZ64957.1 HlyD family efflux transporter periplasmic adaptor subunit [Adonisia turfae CCMR0082]